MIRHSQPITCLPGTGGPVSGPLLYLLSVLGNQMLTGGYWCLTREQRMVSFCFCMLHGREYGDYWNSAGTAVLPELYITNNGSIALISSFYVKELQRLEDYRRVNKAVLSEIKQWVRGLPWDHFVRRVLMWKISRLEFALRHKNCLQLDGREMSSRVTSCS